MKCTGIPPWKDGGRRDFGTGPWVITSTPRECYTKYTQWCREGNATDHRYFRNGVIPTATLTQLFENSVAIRTTRYSSHSCPVPTSSPLLPSTFTSKPPSSLADAGSSATTTAFLFTYSDERTGWFCSDTTADGYRIPTPERGD